MSRATPYQPIADAHISENEATSPVAYDDSDSSSSLLSRETIIKEQERDKISQLALHAVDEKEATIVPWCYFWKNGVLMRKWRPPEVPASHEWKVIFQVVLPSLYRNDVLSLAHKTPMAGHLGGNKTYQNPEPLLFAWDEEGCKAVLSNLPHLPTGGET